MATGSDDILETLNAERVRCTYGAVGGVLGIPANPVVADPEELERLVAGHRRRSGRKG